MSEEQDDFQQRAHAAIAEGGRITIMRDPPDAPILTTLSVSEVIEAHHKQARAELRDRFAMAALTGLLAFPAGGLDPNRRFANLAYEYADAMLKARGDE